MGKTHPDDGIDTDISGSDCKCVGNTKIGKWDLIILKSFYIKEV